MASLYFVAPSSEFVSTYGFGLAAAVYVLGAATRFSASPPSPADEASSSLRRVIEGGYELSATLAAILAGVFMWQRFSDLGLTAGLLFEGMFLFLLGLALKQKYLRLLASITIPLTTCRLLGQLAQPENGVILTSLAFSAATRLALLATALLFALRSFIRLDLLLERSYAPQASLLLTAVLLVEAPPEVMGVSLLVLAGILLWVGSTRRLIDVRCGAYLSGVVGLGITLGINGLLWNAPWRAASEDMFRWLWLGPAALLLAAVAGAAFRTNIVNAEKTGLLHAAVAGGVTFAAFYIWHASPAVLVATFWAILGLCLVEAGLRWPRLQLLRNYGVLLAVGAFGRLFLVNLVNPGATFGVSHRILTVAPMTLLMYYLSVRLAAPGGRAATRSAGRLSDVFIYLGTILAVLLIRFELGRVLAVLGWSGYMAALYYVGLRYNRQTLRQQALLLAGLTFARVWTTNFFVPESLAGSFGRVVTGVCVAAGFFFAQAVARLIGVRTDAENRIKGRVPDEFAQTLFAVAGGLVLAILLYYEASGRLLTVAWGLEGAVLLLVGLLLQDRILRIFSLGLLSVCVAKAFVYDLASLSTPYRILSFVILGALLVAASWFYTHFRARIAARHGHMAGA